MQNGLRCLRFETARCQGVTSRCLVRPSYCDSSGDSVRGSVGYKDVFDCTVLCYWPNHAFEGLWVIPYWNKASYTIYLTLFLVKPFARTICPECGLTMKYQLQKDKLNWMANIHNGLIFGGIFFKECFLLFDHSCHICFIATFISPRFICEQPKNIKHFCNCDFLFYETFRWSLRLHDLIKWFLSPLLT